MTPLPDVKVLAHKVREIAKSNPLNFVDNQSDENCVYVERADHAKPCCIVGHAFVALDYTTDWDEIHPSHGCDFNTTPIMDLYDPPMGENYGYLSWLGSVQRYQDESNVWVDAVELADADLAKDVAFNPAMEVTWS